MLSKSGVSGEQRVRSDIQRVGEGLEESVNLHVSRARCFPSCQEGREGGFIAVSSSDCVDSSDCFVSLEQADTALFQTQSREAVNNLITTMRGEAGVGCVDMEYAREMLRAREEVFIRPSVRE